MKQANIQTTGNRIKKAAVSHNGDHDNSSNSSIENGSLNKKIGYLRDRLKNTVQLSFEKAAAHHQDPAKYPLSTDNKTIERAFHNLLEALPRIKRNKIIDNINKTLRSGSPERNNLYGELVNINFRSAVPVADQVRSIPVQPDMKITESDAEKIIDLLKNNEDKPVRKNGQYLSGSINNNKLQPRQAVSANKVSFNIENLTCIKTDDIRKDEISITGFAIDSQGNSVDIDTFFVGKFKKGDAITLNRKLIDLNLPGGFPAVFIIGLFIIERDLISDLVLVEKLKLLIEAIALALYAAAIVTAIFQLAPLVWILLIIGMGFAIMRYVFSLMGDDLSFIAEDSLTLLDKINVGDSFDRSIKIGDGRSFLSDFDGEYSANARWVGEA